jgi:OmpA family protein/PEGA domain-containing protein
MSQRHHRLLLVPFLAVGLLAWAGPAFARSETGKIHVYVRPIESEIFLDGQHMGNATWDGTLMIKNISPGDHTVSIYNTGYTPESDKVTVEAGKTMALHVRLEPLNGDVNASWGRLEVKGSPRSGVLLNGKTEEYVVGHPHEEMIVPAGDYQTTVTHEGKDVWAGAVTVPAGQTAVVNTKGGGSTKTGGWKGAKSGDIMRFHGGLFHTWLAVPPVSGDFSANPTSLNCGQSTKLTWSSAGAVKSEISGIGAVPASGEQDATPKADTSYTFTATGPGGSVTKTAAVTINNTFNSTLTVSPQEVHYRKVGDKVEQQDSATVSWSAGNAQHVSVDPLGTVQPSGSQSVTPTPQQTTPGPVDETLTYKLTATNDCGGSETRTASLHLVGSIEAAVGGEEAGAQLGLVLVSVFFPTDYPDPRHPEGGLLKSQQSSLERLSTVFKKYLEYDPNAKLELEAHADARASVRHNQELTERRAARVKDYLSGQGISAGSIDTKALGKKDELSQDQVTELEGKNPNPPPAARAKAKRANWWAYNRRVDLVLMPKGERSKEYYPHNAADSQILWQSAHPRWKVVEANQ